MVSIIVPAYNCIKSLECCVGSIRQQTYTSFELILVDDGSADGSGELCDKFAAEDTRIRVIHKPNGGVSSARNAGIDAVTGEILKGYLWSFNHDINSIKDWAGDSSKITFDIMWGAIT